jgi:hypothetical protein
MPCCFTRSCASSSSFVGPDLWQQKKKPEEEDSSDQATAVANCIISAKEEENYDDAPVDLFFCLQWKTLV